MVGELVVVVLLVLAVVLYFLPSLVAYRKRNGGAICVLNLLLGWTLLGWVVAMLWACTDEAPTNRPTPNCGICGNPVNGRYCGFCGVMIDWQPYIAINGR